jgi:hypothetical protein
MKNLKSEDTTWNTCAYMGGNTEMNFREMPVGGCGLGS